MTRKHAGQQRGMDAPYNGYTGRQRQAIIDERKRLQQLGDLRPLAYLLTKRACEVCGDPECPTQWHSEDYSRPYLFAPPATFVICAVCHLRLHKRFNQPSEWLLFLEHLRSGGYGREFTGSYSLKQRQGWRSRIETGRPVELRKLRKRRLTGVEWWQTLTLDRQSLTAAWARPRPWRSRPPLHDYVSALNQIEPNQKELALLRFHAECVKRSATMRCLANAVLSANSPCQASLTYGRLARRLAEVTGWDPERRADGSRVWMSMVAEGWQPAVGEFEWVMVPALVQAFADAASARFIPGPPVEADSIRGAEKPARRL